jgi:putative transposase
VTKTATVSLHGNLYEVDPAFAGSKVELVFDPFDLTDITVRHHGRPAGKATPFKIGRHVHPKAAADTPPPATPTGIDYLRLLEDRQTRALGERLRYAQLTEPAPTEPITTAPPNQQPAALQPATDHDGLRYDADLLTLAAHTSAAAAERVEVTG